MSTTASRPPFLIGTSGYSFADWVGPFYPPGTQSRYMFNQYIRHFPTVEINYTYYRMPSARTLASLADKSPPDFTFWVKANQETTHKRNREVARPFVEALAPLREAGKLAGVLLQFPQSFHRTVENRSYLAAVLDDLGVDTLAVEFRHNSWNVPAVMEGLRQRCATLVVPDVPAIESLFHIAPTTTSSVGYLRLHSRDASKWYAGGGERYDYFYNDDELNDLAAAWAAPNLGASTIYTFFNNCHRGQAAENAQRFREIVKRL